MSRYKAKKYDNAFKFAKHVSDCSNPSSVANYNEKTTWYINKR